mgnify:CR=1 FL=1
MNESRSTDAGALIRDSFAVATRTDNLVPLLLDALFVLSVGTCTAGILFPALFHGYTAMCMRAARGDTVTIGESFQGIQRFGGAFVLGLLVLLILVVTTIVPILGNFVGACVAWWAWCFHVDHPEASALDAIKGSFGILRAHLVETVLVAAVCAGLHALLFATGIGLVLTLAFSGVLTAVAYRRLAG